MHVWPVCCGGVEGATPKESHAGWRTVGDEGEWIGMWTGSWSLKDQADDPLLSARWMLGLDRLQDRGRVVTAGKH